MTNSGVVLSVGALLFLAALMAGCGDEDSTAATEPLPERIVRIELKPAAVSKERYVELVETICDESWAFMLDSFERRYRRVAHAYQNEQDKRAEGKRFQSASRNVFLAGMQAQFDDIMYVGAPQGDEDRVFEVLHALQRAVYNGWERRITSAKEFAKLFNHFTVRAYYYGLNRCLAYESNFREQAKDREESLRS